jgi:hypothetical protein
MNQAPVAAKKRNLYCELRITPRMAHALREQSSVDGKLRGGAQFTKSDTMSDFGIFLRASAEPEFDKTVLAACSRSQLLIQHLFDPMRGSTMNPISTPDSKHQFSYKSVDSELANRLKKSANRIRGLMRRSLAEIGQELAAVKSKLDHGSWGPWLSHEFALSAKTAERYIRASEMLTKHNITGDIADTAIYVLAAPSTPVASRENILGRIQGGEKLTVRQIASEIAKAKQKVQATQPPSKALKKRVSGRTEEPSRSPPSKGHERKVIVARTARDELKRLHIDENGIKVSARLKIELHRIVIRSIIRKSAQVRGPIEPAKPLRAKSDW